MPETRIVTAEQLSKEEEDFNAVFDNIEGKSTEEIAEYTKSLDEVGDASGDAQKDQSNTDDDDSGKSAYKDSTSDKTNTDQIPESDTTGGLTQDDSWKAKAEQLEAELQKERQRTSSWDGRIKAANQKAKELEAEVKMLRAKLDEQTTSKKTEEEQSDQEVMEKFKETFPELVDVISIMEKKVNSVAAPKAKDPEPSATKDELTTEPDANSDGDNDSSGSAVCNIVEVRKVHADVDEAVSSGKIVTWINTQPDYLRPSLENVYYGTNGFGSTQQVIDLLNNFKKDTGWKSSVLKSKDRKSEKLRSMIESEGDSGGPVDRSGPDMNDFDAAADEAGL